MLVLNLFCHASLYLYYVYPTAKGARSVNTSNCIKFYTRYASNISINTFLFINLKTGVQEPGSTVSVVTRLRNEMCGFLNPSVESSYSLSYTPTPAVAVTQLPDECGPWLLLDGKTFGSVVDQSPPSSALVRNEWSHTSVALYTALTWMWTGWCNLFFKYCEIGCFFASYAEASYIFCAASNMSTKQRITWDPQIAVWPSVTSTSHST